MSVSEATVREFIARINRHDVAAAETPIAQRWRIPAVWRAEVRGGLIELWQVYADNKPVSDLLERAR